MEGVLHESMINTQCQAQGDLLEGVVDDFSARDGRRSRDPAKYRKDAEMLRKALEIDKDNSRYVYYLALSYVNSGELELALKSFEKRATMNGENEETFFSQFGVGYLEETLQKGFESIVESYSKAYQLNPTRREPIDRLAHLFQEKGCFWDG